MSQAVRTCPKPSHYAVLWMLGLGSAYLAGCNDPVACERIAQREENMAKTIQTFQQIEDDEAADLNYVLDSAAQQYREDVIRSTENPGIVHSMIEEDIQRFHDRQPEYQREIQEGIRGNPEKIKETLPDLIY